MGISIVWFHGVFLFLRSVRTLDSQRGRAGFAGGTFGALYVFGYSIDNLSLMALTIATGFVVDDAIVVIENIRAISRKAWSRCRQR